MGTVPPLSWCSMSPSIGLAVRICVWPLLTKPNSFGDLAAKEAEEEIIVMRAQVLEGNQGTYTGRFIE